jgi:hypothetical protein
VSEPHDFAVHIKRSGQERHPRPPHPRPALVTFAQCPFDGTGWQTYSLIFASEKQKYFFEGGLAFVSDKQK